MARNRDNIPNLTFDRPWKWLLLPGLLIQWSIYMFPNGPFSKVVANTRQARSPFMTYVFSGMFYLVLASILFMLIAKPN